MRCGLDESIVLQIDHVRGGGTADRGAKSVHRWYTDVFKCSTDFQLLCANCHVRKSRENGEYGSPIDKEGGE